MENLSVAAPNAAKRFVELVELGYYNDTPIFRVVKNPQPFVAQFGINWRKGMIDWRDKNFNDDPSLFHLDRGTLAFAKAGPNTNSTQVFINYGNNDFLQSQNFSTFGKVVTGVIYLFTGGLLGFGWFIDLFLLGGYVDTYNAMFMARTAVKNTNTNVNNVVVNIPGHLTAPQQPTQTAQPVQPTQEPQAPNEEGNNSSAD